MLETRKVAMSNIVEIIPFAEDIQQRAKRKAEIDIDFGREETDFMVMTMHKTNDDN